MTAACGQPQSQAGTSPATETPTATPTASAAPSPSSSPIASPKPQPSTSPSLLFAALEAIGTANTQQWNTVVIAGLDGHARAKATFTPMPVPTLGCIGNVPLRSAQVAAGKVFYSDAKGVVRSLSIDGTVATAATFPLTSSQQMLSFAVSPDGSRLLGAVFTLPAKPNIGCSSSPGTGYSLDVYAAAAAGPRTLLYHRSLPTPPGSVLAFTGWDLIGPVGTYPTVWASQGGGPASELGVAVRIDPTTGRVLRQIANPSSCLVWDTAASGDFVCEPFGSTTVSVRRPDGREIWHFSGAAPNGFFYYLAPDETHVTASAVAGYEVLGRDGKRVKLGAGFFPISWLDRTTVVGAVGLNTNLSYVRLSAPGTVVSLGLQGLFVGTLLN